jgi:protein-tyrosine-phosphatase
VSTTRGRTFLPCNHLIDHHLRLTVNLAPIAPATPHWSFPDPSKATGSQEEQLAVYHRVRDAIRAKIADELLQDAGGVITPAPRDEA